MNAEIEAVAFDCFGTLIDFGDEAFAAAYEVICRDQGIPIDGQTFYDKWMEVWRRLAAVSTPSPESNGDLSGQNTPGPLSEAEDIPEHPAHHHALDCP